MPDAIAVGPFLVRTLAAALWAAALVALWLSVPLARRAGLDGRWPERVLVLSLVSGVLAARAAHVLAQWPAYSARPWSALYLWLPGYSPGHGMAFAVAVALLALRARPATERGRGVAVLAAACTGGATLAALLLALTMMLAPPVAGVGSRMPEFVLQDLQGRPVRWSQLQGRAVVLNAWATWCAPCRRELPMLGEAATAYAARGVSFVGVSIGESAEQVRAFAASTGVTLPIWMDPPGRAEGSPSQALFDRLGGIGLPTTWFVGADGRIVATVTGELSPAVLREWTERLADGER